MEALAHEVVAIRQGAVSDLALIRNSWTKSYGKHSPAGDCRAGSWARIPQAVYEYEQHRLIGRLLERALVLVACNPEDADQIFGYIVAEQQEQPVYHYLYVKDSFRKLGIATQLYGAAAQVLGGERAWSTHWTPVIAGVIDKRKLAIRYNPYRSFLHE